MTDVVEPTVYSGFQLPVKRLPDVVGCTPDEWAVRVDLAAAYQQCASFGWDDLI